MIDVKCKACNKLLLKCNVFIGAIKCPRCKMIFEYKTYQDLYFYGSYDKIKPEPPSSNPVTGNSYL